MLSRFENRKERLMNNLLETVKAVLATKITMRANEVG